MGASLQSKSEIAQRQNYSRHHDSLSQSFPFFNVLKGGKLAKMKVFFFPPKIHHEIWRN